MAMQLSDSASELLDWECPALFSESEEGDNLQPQRVAQPVPPKLMCFDFGCHTILLTASARGAISARVWRGAVILSRALLTEVQLVKDMHVLELGCGVGLCGILVSLLGASHVALTDCSWDGLKALLPNVNRARGRAGDPIRGTGSWGTKEDSIQIRWHLWQTDEPRSPGRGPPQHWSNEARCTWGSEGPPPELEAGKLFSVVIGADVLYFHQQVAPLAATVSSRLTRNGTALFALTVRRRDVYTAFIEMCQQCGLVVVSDAAVDVDALDDRHFEQDAVDGSDAQVGETANAQEVRLVRLVRAI